MQSMKNDAENKILILYTLNITKTPLTKHDLSIIVLDNLLMNYFTFNQSIEDLKEGKFIVYDDSYVDLTEQGKNMLKLFVNSLDNYKKMIIDKYMQLNREKVEENNSVHTNITALDIDKYEVNLNLLEKNNSLFDLKIIAPNNEIAQVMVENFEVNHVEVYRRILNLLMNQK